MKSQRTAVDQSSPSASSSRTSFGLAGRVSLTLVQRRPLTYFKSGFMQRSSEETITTGWGISSGNGNKKKSHCLTSLFLWEQNARDSLLRLFLEGRSTLRGNLRAIPPARF